METNDHRGIRSTPLKIANVYSNSIAPYYLDVEIALIDTMSNSIDTFLANKINTDPDLKYLLIIADENDIPSPTKSVNCGEGPYEYPSDDFYTSIDQDNPPRLATGRIPTSNTDKAMSYAEKLKKYGNRTVGNKTIAYMNILNFVVLIPKVMGNIGILAFL